MAKNALLFKGGPLRQLKHGARRTGGRNNLGRITSFHRGGGAKRSLRDIDMKRSEPDMIGTVERIEYDPFRTGRTALIRWDDDGKERAPMQGRANGDKEDRKIKGTKGREFPRGVRDVPRQALRSAVATICGVSVLPTPRKPVMVKVDGTRKFSSLAGETGRNAMGISGEGLPWGSNFLGKEDQLKYFEERSLKDLTTGRCKGIIHRSPILTGIIIEKLSETKIQ